MMIAAIILVVSVVFLAQFFLAYCRSVLAKSAQQELSPEARQVTGIDDHRVKRGDFQRLVQLVDLCPEPGDDGAQLRAVRVYYAMMNAGRSLAAAIAPALRDWIEREQAACGYFAAVVLDRRIAHNRGLMAEQMANRS
ncbi:MAG: hypothetical protein ACRD5W_17945 [Candidatus Acidiferrales bacterium]